MDPEICFVDDEEGYLTVYEALNEMEPKVIGLDIETTAVPWYDPDFRILCVALATPEKAFIFQSPYWLKEAYKLIWKNEIPLVMQNGAFDAVALRQWDIFIRDWEDTLILEYCKDMEISKGLTDLAKRYLGVKPWKDINYKHPEREDPEVLGRLCGRDASYTVQVWNKQSENMEPALRRLYTTQMTTQIVLMDMEIEGIPVDKERLSNQIERVQDEVDRLLEDIQVMAKQPKLNPNSYKQLGRVLYHDLKLPIKLHTKTGNPSTAAEALTKIAHMHPIVPKVLEFKSLRKLLTASLLPWFERLDDQNLLHPRYKPAQVRTGRLASEMPNIQQVPRDPSIRSIFGGVEGKKIVEIDYSQMELRVAAWLAGEDELIEAFVQDKDPHQITADAFKVDRQTAKALNFGLLFGAGFRKLVWIAETQYGVILTEPEAEFLRNEWFKRYPAFEKFHEACIAEARLRGGVETVFGRWRPLPDIWNSDFGIKAHAERQAINTPVQSPASDITLIMLNTMYKHIIFHNLDARPIATVHDSILFLVDDNEVDIFVAEAQRIMEDRTIIEKETGVWIDVPLKTDVKISTHWGE